MFTRFLFFSLSILRAAQVVNVFFLSFYKKFSNETFTLMNGSFFTNMYILEFKVTQNQRLHIIVYNL